MTRTGLESKPQISVIIPVYNRSLLLRRALISVQNQSFKNFEILVIDDHSTEDLQGAVKEFPVRFMKTEGQGVSAARNTGIRHSKSPWIAFLDSDDEWLPLKLEKQMAYLSQHPNCSIVHSNEIWIRNNEVIKQNSKQQKLGGRIFSNCTQQCLIGPSSVLLRKSLLDQVGFFDESFSVCEDFDLWLRISASEDIGFLSEELIIKHGGHEDQLSRRYHSMDLWRVRALAKQIGNQNLDANQIQALQISLKQKCEILLKGFQKHQNFEHEAEVKKYLGLCPSL